MPNNSKARSEQILLAAQSTIHERGIDVREQVDINALAKEVQARTSCHIDTARKWMLRAVMRARGDITHGVTEQRGGAGRGQGRKPTREAKDVDSVAVRGGDQILVVNQDGGATTFTTCAVQRVARRGRSRIIEVSMPGGQVLTLTLTRPVTVQE